MSKKLATRRRGMRRRIAHLLEAAAAYLVFGAIVLLPVDAASAFGGWVGRTLGPRLGISKRAARNLARAMPEKSPAEIAATISGMWDNLARTVAEAPHVHKFWDPRFPDNEAAIREAIAKLRESGQNTFIAGPRLEVTGLEYIDHLLARRGAALFFSAHLGNWEVLPCWAAHIGIPISVVFRMPNNPYIAPLVARLRGNHGPLLPKGLKGALASVKVLEAGGRLGMLMDQKQNRGVAVPFFGRPAMTATAIAKLALRFDCPIYGAWAQRLGGARFRIHFAPPVEITKSGSEDADIMTILTRINNMLEEWIRVQPDQWTWMHRRWPD